MYSKRLVFAVCGLLVWTMFSCATKKDVHEHDGSREEDVTEWKAMDDFHMIMAETFHPFKDSANLEPVRMRATELLVAADKWLQAPLPGKVDNDRVRSKLAQLKSEAATLAESVKSADDNVIAEQLNRLHDTFHTIQEAWYE